MRFTEADNQLHATFKQRMDDIRARYFSREPRYWPIFSDPGLLQIIQFRKTGLAPQQRLELYPEGINLFNRLEQTTRIPARESDPGTGPLDLLLFAAALSKDWENPASVENVVSMSADPAIYGTILGTVANANLVHREYAEMACNLEAAVVRQIATLVGYDPARAAGIFTQGGTFCNLYGYLLGIRKNLPEAKHFGMGYTHDYRIINSQGGHYSNTTNLSLLGVSIREKTIRIKVEENNDIDVDDFAFQLEACFRLKCAVPTIMLTMGTTDTFGVDRVKPIWEIRNRLCDKYHIATKPHIHVDAAIGWSLLFFLNYDFAGNPLCINGQTLQGLRRNVEKFNELQYADSFTVDFQKWGYVPYTSSLVMIKDGKDLDYMENDPENFSYFEKETQGQTHLQSTIECSRGAAGVFGAFAALNYLGIEGYQTVLAHCLQNANYFRYCLHERDFVKVLSSENQGPSVAFRVYNPDKVKNADKEFHREYVLKNTDDYQQRIDANSAWHRDVFLRRGKKGLYTNWVKSIAHTTYNEVGEFIAIPGEKAVFMNPRTERQHIDEFIENLLAA